MVDEIIKQGHEIANHCDTHRTLIELSFDEIKGEILSPQDAVKQAFGIEMKYFRPAGLKAGENLLGITNELNMPVIYDSHRNAYLADWNSATTPSEIPRGPLGRSKHRRLLRHPERGCPRSCPAERTTYLSL